MAQQIVKKFIADAAIDGEKLLLEEGQAIRVQDGATVIDLVKYQNEKVFVAGDEVAIQSALDAEIQLREQGDIDLGLRIDSTEDRLDIIEGTGEGSIAKAVADLVGAAPSTLDTLKELADALGSDPNFAATVASQIGAIEDALEDHIEAMSDAHDAAAISVASGTGLVATDVQAALGELKSDVGFALSAAQAAQSEVDALEMTVSELETEVSSIQSTLTEIDGRLDAVEAILPTYKKEKFVLTSSDLAHITLAEQILVNSLVVSIGRLMAHETDDYTLSTVNGLTRITWAGDFADMNSELKLEVGDVIYLTYAYVA